jgi:hypothetical protein
MLTIALLIIIALLASVLVVVFHHHMVNLRDWHLYLSAKAAATEKDLLELRQWVEEHFHLHTAPPSASPAGQGTQASA